LANIAAHLDQPEGSGVKALIAGLNACDSSEDCEVLCECVGRYQDTSGSIITAAAEIAGVAIRTNSRELVEKLMIAVAPEAMRESKATRELLPALARLKMAGPNESEVAEPVWAAAIGVCVAVAGSNHSSALHLARHLGESLAPLPPEIQLAYLKSFQRIVEDAGISLLGYATKRLPALFLEVGDNRCSDFVAQGAAIARRYGKIAAEEFFEQRSGASREAAPVG
jgi:hypothetical protein